MPGLGPALGLTFLLAGLCMACGKGDSKAASTGEPLRPAALAVEDSAAANSAAASNTAANNAAVKSAAKPKIKAHRGASKHAPENTSAAVKLAFASGADAAEIDVRISSDRVAVIIHDEDTDRVGRRKRTVASQTLAELKELDVGSWMRAEFASERIPTLDEILLLVPAGKTLFIEIKDGPNAVPIVLESIRTTKSLGSFAIESFSLEVLEAVGRAMPDLPRHWTISAKEKEGSPKVFLPHEVALVGQAKALGFSGLAVDARGLGVAFAEATRAAGLELGVWTIDRPAIARAIEYLPITYIETNDPALIRRALYE